MCMRVCVYACVCVYVLKECAQPGGRVFFFTFFCTMFLYVRMVVCVCMYMCVSVYVCVYVHVYVCVHMCMCVCTRVCVYVHMVMYEVKQVSSCMCMRVSI